MRSKGRCAAEEFRPGWRMKQSGLHGLTKRNDDMAKVMVVTSGKGGVGKTTSTAALGAALAQLNHKVAVVDFDVGLRNLDLVMGAERRGGDVIVNVAPGTGQLTQH